MVAASAPIRPDDEPRGISRDATIPTVTRDQSVTSSLLDNLASPHHSLASVAAKHNLTLDALLAWLSTPETRQALATRESAAYAHVRYVGALNLSHAVHAAARIVESFNAAPRAADPLDPASFRAATNARKAAWLLMRVARLVPISDAQIAAARHTLRTSAQAHLHPDPAPDLAPDLAPPSPAPTPAPRPQAAHDPRKSPASERHTFHGATNIPRPNATDIPRPNASHNASKYPAAPVHGISGPDRTPREPSPVPSTTPERGTAGGPDDLQTIFDQLQAVARSLGIELPDLDAPDAPDVPYVPDVPDVQDAFGPLDAGPASAISNPGRALLATGAMNTS